MQLQLTDADTDIEEAARILIRETKFYLISGFHLIAGFKAEIRATFKEKGRKVYNSSTNKS